MKKNKALRAASALLVLTLLTTSIIGGTFAKYTTSGSVNDTARVAKWGVDITTSGALYSDAYAIATAADGKENLPATWVADPGKESITVAAATQSDNIVAPGTKSYGNGLSFSISGVPEVAVTVKTTIKAEDIFLKAGTYGVLVPATVSDTDSLQKVANTNDLYALKNGTYTKVTTAGTYDSGSTYHVLTNETTLTNDYYPVEYKLNGSTGNNGTGDLKTAVGIAKKLANAVKSGATDTANEEFKASYEVSDNFAANTNLGTAGPKFGNEKLEWEWKFENTDKNPADTILGDLIADRGNTNPSNVVVSVDTNGVVTALIINEADNDYTVTDGTNVVANLCTMFNISLEVTQID